MPRSTADARAHRQAASAEGGRPTLLDTEQSADLLRLRPSTLEAWRWRGTGPRYIKLGSRVMYRLRDLDAFLEDQARTSTSDPGPEAG